MSKPRRLYAFLDEAGNFDFSPTGTKYFVLACVSQERPLMAAVDLQELKFDLLETGIEIAHFHASEDKQPVRNAVFSVIQDHLTDFRIDALIVEKSKTNPSLYSEEEFYPMMLGYLLRYVAHRCKRTKCPEMIVVTDSIPVAKKRKAIEKATRTTLKEMLPKGVLYRVVHHPSMSNLYLQIADYCCWAIQRKWAKGDERSYSIVKPAIGSEFDIFRTGSSHFY